MILIYVNYKYIYIYIYIHMIHMIYIYNFKSWITTFKFVLMPFLATYNPLNIVDTTQFESTIFYNVEDPSNRTR